MITLPMQPGHRVAWSVCGLTLLTMLTLGACTLLADFPDYNICGNNRAEADEQCDGDDLNGRTCPEFARYANGIACTDNCQIDLTGCGGTCGDGIWQDTYEDCDGSDFGGTHCSDHDPSSSGGTLHCTDQCALDLSECNICGDNIIDPEEDCDGENNGDQDCYSLDAGTGGELRCTLDCRFDLSNCGICGDAICQFDRGEGATSCSADCAYSEIAAGEYATCALRGPGMVWCWGTGEGVGPSMSETVPTRLPGNLLFTKLVAGKYHFCALTRNGEVYCWGSGYNGQLGNGASGDETSPVAVDLGELQAVELSAGENHTCAVIPNGSLYCWGLNAYGCLGVGENPSETNTPLQVTSVNDARFVAAGALHTCVVRESGVVSCWGSGFTGQLGHGEFADSLDPVDASGIVDAVAVTAGDYFTCALESTGVTSCWGDNITGQVGDGTTEIRLVPTPLSSPPTDLVSLDSGWLHSCGVGQDDVAYCWGDSEYGKLGRLSTMPLCDDAPIGDTIAPVLQTGPSPISPIMRVTAGTHHSCALNTGGMIYCWGLDNGGLLGSGPSSGECVSEARLVANQ